MVNAAITTFSRSAMLLFHKADMGKVSCVLTQPVGSAIAGTVIDDNHFVVFDFPAGILMFQCQQALLKNQQM